jgi:hypothetical protein
MKKLLSGLSAVAIAVATFAFVQAKTVADIPCVTESGVANSVWFFYSSVSDPTPNSSSILVAANYIKATDVSVCDETTTLCAICAVPQGADVTKPNLSQARIQTALANYNFSATLTLDPSGVILEKEN